MVEPIDHRATMAQRLSAQVTARILSGELAPGISLKEEELVRRYAVSRHVIREVLRMLAADGLVEYRSFKGARVPQFTESDARDIYQARRIQECSSESMMKLPNADLLSSINEDFARAVRKKNWKSAFDLDVAFHMTIVAASNGERASAWHRSLMQQLRLAELMVPTFNSADFVASVAQHAGIVDAIKAGDVVSARRAMRYHLDAAERALVVGLARSAA